MWFNDDFDNNKDLDKGFQVKHLFTHPYVVYVHL